MRRLFVFGFMLVTVVSLAQDERPVRQRFAQRIQQRGDMPAGETFDSEGVRIHYTVEGEGEPVLLIHGFRASANMNWRAPGVTQLLAQHYKVVSIDNRGHGQSDKPEQEGMYGVKMVEDCVRLLDHLNIEKAHWVGYSMGGMITLKALATHPERIQSAIIGGMGWIERRREDPERMVERGTNDTPAYQACLKGFPELTLSREELLAVKVPMTVVIGADDPFYARAVKPLAEARPDVPVVVVPEGSHLTCIMKPEFKTAITEALAGHKARQ